MALDLLRGAGGATPRPSAVLGGSTIYYYGGAVPLRCQCDAHAAAMSPRLHCLT